MNSKNSRRFHVKKVLDASSGFTLVEVITVLVIISILALFAAPEVINWRPNMRLKRAADTLFSDMQRAKIHAIKNNVSVIFTFTTGAGSPCKGGSYQFTDNAVPANVVANVPMVDNICLKGSDFVAGDGFTSRGLPIIPPALGSIKTIELRNADLSSTSDPIYKISQSVAGGISLKKDKI